MLLSGSANYNLRYAEELVIVPPPFIGMARMVTFFRFVNNDSADCTPDVQVKSTNDKRLASDDEYIRTYPTRIIAPGEWMEDAAPVVMLTHEDSWVVELAADITNADAPPTLFVTWLDDQIGAPEARIPPPPVLEFP